MTISEMSGEAFAAYVAGFFDGEGHVSIYAHECGVKVVIGNTEPVVLHAIRDRLGYGAVRVRPRQSLGYRDLHVFEVSNAHDGRAFLSMVAPYIQIKNGQADNALAIFARQQERFDELDARNRAILAAIAAGDRQKDIAARYGVSQSLISRIKLGHMWPSEITRLNARRGLKKWLRPSADVFRLHGGPAPEESLRPKRSSRPANA